MKMPRRRRLSTGFWPVPVATTEQLLPPLWLALAAAVIAAVVMPHQSPFPYRFETGQPWNYATLKAPFDFEVLHPEEQVQDELRRIEAGHVPCYSLRTEVARQQKQLLADLIREQARISRNDTQFEDLVAKPSVYSAFGQQLLDRIYARGIAGPELEGLRQENPNAEILLIDGPRESRRPASAFLTIRDAQD